MWVEQQSLENYFQKIDGEIRERERWSGDSVFPMGIIDRKIHFFFKPQACAFEEAFSKIKLSPGLIIFFSDSQRSRPTFKDVFSKLNHHNLWRQLLRSKSDLCTDMQRD